MANEQFRKDLHNFKIQIKDQAIETLRAIVESAFRDIIHRSPVWHGSYVSSHRIGIGTADATVTNLYPDLPDHDIETAGGGFLPAVSEGEAQQLKGQALGQIKRLVKAQPFDTVYISNRISHAIDVEYLGWAKKPAYHVYELTVAELQAKFQILVKKGAGREL